MCWFLLYSHRSFFSGAGALQGIRFRGSLVGEIGTCTLGSGIVDSLP